MGLADIVRLLQGSEFFSRLLQDDLYWLASKAELSSMPTGTVLFNPGETARRFFIVRQGSVAVSRIDASGRPEEMARFEKGDVVGDFDFARGASYDAMATCVADSDLLVFPGHGSTMDDLVAEKPETAARVLLRMVAMISSRVRSTQALISNNAPWVRVLRRQMYTDAATGLWSRSFLDDCGRRLERTRQFLVQEGTRPQTGCRVGVHLAAQFAHPRRVVGNERLR